LKSFLLPSGKGIATFLYGVLLISSRVAAFAAAAAQEPVVKPLRRRLAILLFVRESDKGVNDGSGDRTAALSSKGRDITVVLLYEQCFGFSSINKAYRYTDNEGD